jgi:Sulfotransferase family
MSELPRITFVHVPKTAGNSVLNALKSIYNENDVSPFIYEGRTDIAGWPQFRLIAGHMGFAFAKKFGTEMITVVRDPLERTVSLYNFWRTGRTKMREVLKNMTLEDFLKSENEGIVVNRDNTQTWQLAHSLVAKRQRESGLSGDALLERAFKNLEKIAVVGATERLDQLSLRFSTAFNVELPPLAHANKTRSRLPAAELSAEAQELIAKCTALDRRLYEHILGMKLHFRNS